MLELPRVKPEGSFVLFDEPLFGLVQIVALEACVLGFCEYDRSTTRSEERKTDVRGTVTPKGPPMAAVCSEP